MSVLEFAGQAYFVVGCFWVSIGLFATLIWTVLTVASSDPGEDHRSLIRFGIRWVLTGFIWPAFVVWLAYKAVRIGYGTERATA